MHLTNGISIHKRNHLRYRLLQFQPALCPFPASDARYSDPEVGTRPKRCDPLERSRPKADREICTQFHILEYPPPYCKSEASQTPFWLYGAILPVTDHDIIFPGKVGTGNRFRVAEAQELRAVVVLDGVTISERPSGPAAKEGMEKVVAKTVWWCRRRYLAKWETGNWFY